MRYFYVIYIKDEILGRYLNAIRYIGNPKEKNDAHITVRGPYNRPLTNIKRYNDIISNEEIIIKSVGTFFGEKQNTVFLTCEATKLKEVWHKSDYEYNPHIALYDGNSRQFAESLVAILNSHLINFSFKVDKLSLLKSEKGQADYKLRLNTNLMYINNKINKNLSYQDIDNLDIKSRVEIIDALTSFLSMVKAKKPLSVKIDPDEGKKKVLKGETYYFNFYENEEYIKQKGDNFKYDLNVLKES
jgi:2'-5' RNA ligase